MKKFALFLSVFWLLSVAPAPLAAQSLKLKADIPFAFVINGKTLPAGEYAIEPGTIFPGVLLVRNEGSRDNAMVWTDPVSSSHTASNSTAKLIFDRYGDRYFLSQVWPGFATNGFEVNTSGAERNAARERAATQSETVTVLAMR